MSILGASHGQSLRTPAPIRYYYTAVEADATAGGGAAITDALKVGHALCYDPVQVAAGNGAYVTRAIDNAEVDNRLMCVGIVTALSPDAPASGQTTAGLVEVAPLVSGCAYKAIVKANASIITPTPLGIVTGGFELAAVTEGTALAYFAPTVTADTSTTAALQTVIAR